MFRGFIFGIARGFFLCSKLGNFNPLAPSGMSLASVSAQKLILLSADAISRAIPEAFGFSPLYQLVRDDRRDRNEVRPSVFNPSGFSFSSF